ncbi:MAG: ABC transporter ATP-binding protein [Candidatus Rokubacteria bacterium]|nr:ABC transporter ATP-binding protein [Candidatus Rokubacteria bacterium]
MASIHLADVSKLFGHVTALRPVRLNIRDGEFFVLLGPSGCGKTTLLRVIAGLESPTTGEVLINGHAVTHLPPKHRDVAMVFQDYALYPHMTVSQNLAFPLQAQTRPRAEIEKTVREVAERLQLGALLDRRPRQLSGGQQQRVALGRAMVRNPKAFLMDEPLSNLDAKLRIQMRGELKRLQKDLGITTVYVTHDQEEAMTMSDRIAVLRDGTVQQVAPPDDLYRRPLNRWVAEFVGNPPMSVFAATARLDGGLMLLEPEGEPRARLACPLRDVPETLLVGIRPEHFSIHSTPIDGALPGRVHVVEPAGDHAIVVVRTEAGLVNIKTGADDPPRMDELVFLTVRPDKLHLFARQSGERIGP